MKRFHCDRRASASLNRERRRMKRSRYSKHTKSRESGSRSSLSRDALEFRELVESNGGWGNQIIGNDNRPACVLSRGSPILVLEICLRLVNLSLVSPQLTNSLKSLTVKSIIQNKVSFVLYSKSFAMPRKRTNPSFEERESISFDLPNENRMKGTPVIVRYLSY